MIYVYVIQYTRWFRHLIYRIINKINSRFNVRVIRYLIYDRAFSNERENFMRVDLGCGGSGKGQVNLDLFVEKNKHRSYDLKIKKLKNFIIGDCQCLPFRSKIFQASRMSHVLEHLPEPLTALREMKRISKSKAIIIVPNQNPIDNTLGHLYAWTEFTFNNLMRMIFKSWRVIVSPYDLIAICNTRD